MIGRSRLVRIRGDVEHHRAGRPRHRDVQCLGNLLTRALRIELLRVLRHRPAQRDVIEHLMVVDPHVLRRHLAGKDDDRRAFHHCAGNTGDCVGNPGTERRNQDRWLAGQLPHRIGHERRRGFRLRKDEFDARLLACADGLEHVVSRNAEREARAVVAKGCGDDVGDALEFVGFHGERSVCGQRRDCSIEPAGFWCVTRRGRN